MGDGRVRRQQEEEPGAQHRHVGRPVPAEELAGSLHLGGGEHGLMARWGAPHGPEDRSVLKWLSTKK
jgi:hypothetical protein